MPPKPSPSSVKKRKAAQQRVLRQKKKAKVAASGLLLNSPRLKHFAEEGENLAEAEDSADPSLSGTHLSTLLIGFRNS